MKTISKILLTLILVTASCCTVFSQGPDKSSSNKKSEKIETGHVFIDGEYIEPPYVVKIKGSTILINGNLVFDYQKPVSPFDFKEKPVASFDELHANSGLSDIFKIKDTTYNKSLANIIGFYYLEKYEYSVACDSIAELYRSLPNVKSFISFEGQVGSYQMTSNNEESRIVSMNPFGRKHNLNFGPNGSSYINEDLNVKINGSYEDYCSYLNDNIIILFLSSDEKTNKFVRFVIREKSIRNFCNIILSDKSQEEKFDLLVEILLDQRYINRIIETFTDKSAIIKILEQTSSNINKGTDSKSSTTTNQNTIPNNTDLMAWCPVMFQNEFNSFLSHELEYVVSTIDDQGYTCHSDNYFTDQTDDDNNFGTCTYANLKKLADAGFIYISTHGYEGLSPDNSGNIPPAGLSLVFANTEDAIDLWREGDENIIPFQHLNYWYGDEEPYSELECWSAIATAAWAEEHLAPSLENNNTISILSACHSGSSSCAWVDACAGGICFGYGTTTDYAWGVKDNNKDLLERMNGQIRDPITDEPIYREARDAYNNMPNHRDEFMYSSNNFVRLCPATETYSPGNLERIKSDRTSGTFTIDTWCVVDETHLASDALTFATTDGITITNVYWVMEDGYFDKSRKIEYNWTYDNNVASGHITVSVNSELIVAYGDGNQQLDFDGITPNADQGNYRFYIDPEFSCGISAQPSTLVDLSSEGEHLVTFEAHCNAEISAYSWAFEGGNPSTSTEANPTIEYNTLGLYHVTFAGATSNNESTGFTEYDYIYVYDGTTTENDVLSCNCSVLDKQVTYYAYVDHVPEGVSYDVTVHFGDGYTSGPHPAENPTTIGPILRTFSNYGTYEPYVTISYQGETETLYLSSCGNIQLIDPNPCGDFTVNFDIEPEHPEPGASVEFFPILNDCSGMCHWKWEFATESNSSNYNDEETQWRDLSSPDDGNGYQPYPEEGNYKVRLTAYESQDGCPPAVIEKFIQVSDINSCWDPMYISSEQYNGGYPIDRILVKNGNCGFELRWDIYENLLPGCNCNYPYVGEMFLYPANENADDIPLGKYHWQLPEWSTPGDDPWFETDHYYYCANGNNAIDPPMGLYRFLTVLTSWGPSPAGMQCNVSAKIDVEFVDCDLAAQYIGNKVFINTVNNPPFYSSGNFVLNSDINAITNSEPTVFTACNGIILEEGFETFDYSFEATGDGFADCILSNDNWWGWNNSKEKTIVEENCSEANLSITPNPFKSLITITITIPDDSEIQLNLYDTKGQFINNICMGNYNAGLTELKTDLNYLKPGEYFVEFMVNDKPINTLKIIKQ